jgi:hypothetical protein
MALGELAKLGIPIQQAPKSIFIKKTSKGNNTRRQVGNTILFSIRKAPQSIIIKKKRIMILSSS